METFAKLFSSLLALVYHCFDRIVILGHLTDRLVRGIIPALFRYHWNSEHDAERRPILNIPVHPSQYEVGVLVK